jgi:hypothetical protein
MRPSLASRFLALTLFALSQLPGGALADECGALGFHAPGGALPNGECRCTGRGQVHCAAAAVELAVVVPFRLAEVQAVLASVAAWREHATRPCARLAPGGGFGSNFGSPGVGDYGCFFFFFFCKH